MKRRIAKKMKKQIWNNIYIEKKKIKRKEKRYRVSNTVVD